MVTAAMYPSRWWKDKLKEKEDRIDELEFQLAEVRGDRDRAIERANHLEHQFKALQKAYQDRASMEYENLRAIVNNQSRPLIMTLPEGSIFAGAKADAYRANRSALQAIRLFLSYSGANGAKEIRDTVSGLIPADLGDK